MPLNSYVWKIYKQTEQGKEMIHLFERSSSQNLLATFAKGISYDSQLVDDLIRFCKVPIGIGDQAFQVAYDFFDQIFTHGLTLTYDNEKSKVCDPDSFDFLQYIPELSTWLYCVYPDTFKPYYFTNQFDLLTRIADTFGITLPVVPLKRYKKERLLYFIKLCEVFSIFQKDNQLTSAELCAFLYDFAPNYLEQTEEVDLSLPPPSQVWWIGGNKSGGDFEFVDQASPLDISFWQGNQDTKRGDILIMYCLAPRSYIHSIWRATTDGIADPFFQFYSNIYIGFCHKVPPITIHELKADTHFSKNALVRKNLQGINGYSLDAIDYERILTLIEAKGGNTATLPQLYSHRLILNKELKYESDVETLLLEPLLEKLGYKSSDWEQQLPIRMGRGERNYPDYTFLTDKTKGYEKAAMLIECKLAIRNNRELEEAFKQVWSYGQRLNATVLVLADKDSLWIYQKKHNGFDRTSYTKMYWQELEQPDNFRHLKKLIGKRRKE